MLLALGLQPKVDVSGVGKSLNTKFVAFLNAEGRRG